MSIVRLYIPFSFLFSREAFEKMNKIGVLYMKSILPALDIGINYKEKLTEIHNLIFV